MLYNDETVCLHGYTLFIVFDSLTMYYCIKLPIYFIYDGVAFDVEYVLYDLLLPCLPLDGCRSFAFLLAEFHICDGTSEGKYSDDITRSLPRVDRVATVICIIMLSRDFDALSIRITGFRRQKLAFIAALWSY